MNIKQKMRYSNKENASKGMAPLGIINEKLLLKTIASSSMEKAFMTNQLILT